jgi:hypothetical protein
MNHWNTFISRFTPAEQPIVSVLVNIIRQSLGINDLSAVAELQPQELANLLMTIVGGDNPFTTADDDARLALAQRAISIARDVLAAAHAENTLTSGQGTTPQRAPDLKPKTTFTIVGQIRLQNGKPYIGGIVRAVDKDLRAEEAIGETTTDATGHYEIQYEAAPPRREARSGADVIVRVFDPSMKSREPLAESPVRFQAGARETIDLVVGEVPRTAFDQLLRLLAPALDGVDPAGLTQADVDFLAGDSGIAAERIGWLVTAVQMAAHTGLPAPAFFDYLAVRQRENAAALDQFWRSLPSTFGLQTEAAETFRFAAQAGDVVRFDEPLVTALLDRRATGGIAAAIELALWSSADWRTLIGRVWDGRRASIPSWAQGEDLDAKLSYGAAWLRARAAQVFPTAIVSQASISGRIVTPSNRPAAGVNVQAFHCGFPANLSISPIVQTGADGRYQIVVDSERLKRQLASLGKQPLRLQVFARSSDTGEEIAKSDIRQGVTFPVTVDLHVTLEVGPTEFDLVTERITEIAGGVQLAAIDQKTDLSRLASAAGIDLEITRVFLKAHQSPGTDGLSVEARYALLRTTGLTMNVKTRSSGSSRLQEAVNARIVGKSVLVHTKAADEWLKQRDFDARVEGLRSASGPVDMLKATGLTDGEIDTYIRVLAEDPQATPETIDRRLKEAGLSVTALTAIRRARRLAQIVGPDPTLVGQLLSELAAPQTGGKATKGTLPKTPEEEDENAIGALAGRNAADWQGWLVQRDKSLSAVDAAARARAIETAFERAFPTQALLGRLGAFADKAVNGGPDFARLKNRLETQKDLNLRERGLPFHLPKKGAAPVDATEKSLEQNLAKLQRLSRITSFANAAELLAKGHSSAQSIAAMSREGFVRQMVGTKPAETSSAEAKREDERRREEAATIHQRAKRQSTAALAIATGLSLHYNGVTPKTVPGAGGRTAPESGSSGPAAGSGPVITPPDGLTATSKADLTSLFGAPDACQVAPCQSVLGLSAYFVDLLELLHDSGTDIDPRAVLLAKERRPDLAEIELSCPNAETPVPYIDLVIELLEQQVAPQTRPDSTNPAGTPSNRRMVPLVSLDTMRSVDSIMSPSMGMAGTAGASVNRGTALPVPYPQTTWTAEELAALPEHLNEAAYGRLEKEVFPWTLPFSLAQEEAEVYLRDAELSREELMKRFRPRPPSGWAQPELVEMASARLRITANERKILIAEVGLEEWKNWGYKQKPGDWPTGVGASVTAFLHRTGLHYVDLVELLNTDFINEKVGTARPVATETKPGYDACDLSHTYLTNLDKAFLNRFCRFVRLWRRLGWTVGEVDRAITVLKATAINDVLLVQLAEVIRLAARLTLPVADLLTFWGDLDTQPGFDRTSTLPKPKPSQYDGIFQDRARLSASDRGKLALASAASTTLASVSGPVCAALGVSADDYTLLTDTALPTVWRLGAVSIPAGLKVLAGASALRRWQTLEHVTKISTRELLRFQAVSGLDPFAGPIGTAKFLDAIDTLNDCGLTVDDLDFLLRHVTTSERMRKFQDNGLKLLKRVRDEATSVSSVREPITGALIRPMLIREIARATQVPSPIIERTVAWMESDTAGAGLDIIATAVAPGAQLDSPVNLAGSPGWPPYARLAKWAWLVGRLALSPEDFVMAATVPQHPLQLFPLTSMVVTPTDAAPAGAFANWEQLAALVDVRRRLNAKGLSFWPVRDAVAAATQAADPVGSSWSEAARQIDGLAEATGTLVGSTLLGFGSPAGDAAPGVWIRFLEAVDLAGRLRVPAAKLSDWVKDLLTTATSAEIRGAVAAMRGTDDWKARAPRLRNTLREKQRSVLVAATIHDLDVRTADDLHGRYLVDVEMGSEQLTTRLGLAAASVQRFIQRTLLGVENDRDGNPVAFESDFDGRWKWMKSFRTWRDNRTLFLYPENSLRPELRDDKSPLFLELEQLLYQRDLTADAIEDGLGAYLHKLDDIARLEIMGTCTEEVNKDRLLHIVARTRSVPHDYYHRTWNPSTARFSAWKRLDLDVDGDWVMPIVIDGRLNLYWIKHTRQLEGVKDALGLSPARPFPLSPHFPMYQDQYTLSWSTRQRKGWSAKRTADQQIARPFLPFFETQFAVRLNEARTRLKIGGVTVVPVPPFSNRVQMQSIHWDWAQKNIVDPVLAVITNPPSPQSLPPPSEVAEDIANAKPDFQGMIAELQSIGKTINSVKNAIVGDGADSLVKKLWTTLPDFEDAAQGLPKPYQELLKQISGTLTDLKTLLNSIRPIDGTLPQRALLKTFEVAGSAISGIISDLMNVMKQLPEEILKVGGLFIPEMLNNIHQVLNEISLGLGGPTFGFEFGYFEVGAAGAKGLRLSPPPFPPDGLAMAFGGSLAVLGGSIALLLYSMFPGYPAFHDVPILTGVLYTNLALGGSGPSDLGIKAWPGSGYFLLPSNGALTGTYCTVGVNLDQIKKDALESLDTEKLKNTIFSHASDGPMGALQKMIDLSAGEALANAPTDRLSDLAALFNVGMRVVQPAPLRPFPGRLYDPAPTIVGEDRHGRAFLLNPVSRLDRKGHTFQASYVTWDAVPLYHPLATIMSRTFEQTGVSGLYESATRPGGDIFAFKDDSAFSKSFAISVPGAVNTTAALAGERLDVSAAGAYSLYNWELFYHLPMLIGARFVAQQNFEQALRWYRYIFDPTVSIGTWPQKYWRFKAFYDEYSGQVPDQTISAWLKNLSKSPANDEERLRLQQQTQLIEAWQRDPFNAHLVARLRPGAYERATVMRTIEALISWGDARFREVSWESINEATQLYLMARDILGERPELVPARPRQPLTYKALQSDAHAEGGSIDPFGNVLLTVEASLSNAWDSSTSVAEPAASLAILSGPSMLYFAIPPNEQLLGYWDTVDDRLFKIRHSLDILGKKRSTFPLGSDLAAGSAAGQVVADAAEANAVPTLLAPPAYRFQLMLQKANEFAGDVKALGGALLSALEKCDAEHLARLRSGHEIQLLQATEQVRQLQIDESSRSLEALRQSREGAVLRHKYYTSREFINTAEKVKEVLSIVSSGLQFFSSMGELTAALMHAGPDVSFGGAGAGSSPKADVKYGSTQLGNAASAASRAISLMASMAQTGSALAGTYATYERRKEEWDHQAALAENDMAQFDLQIAAAEKRLTITQRELENHQKQIANAQEIDTFMHEKFSNEELYDWMVGQASAAHFQSYLLALDLAKQAEACYRFERADRQASFIRVEQPDSMATALLSGERLQQNLRRMEAAYMAKNTREYELTKHVSLAQVDPVALLMLQQKGECYFSLPEHVFDADHPGHYLRRLKSVSLSIPCVVGPYTSVNCRLTLDNSEFRVDDQAPVAPQTYARTRGVGPADKRFIDVSTQASVKLPAGTTAIVTSTAQNDGGLFDLHLNDERYLPFEGAGAISSWHLELPKDTNRFDFSTIADVIVHLRYTARDGTPALRDAAWAATFGSAPPTAIAGPPPNPLAAPRRLVRMFNVRHEFPDAWYRFLHPLDDQLDAVLDLDLSASRFPYCREDQTIQINNLRLIFVTAQGSSADGLQARLTYLPGGGQPPSPAIPPPPAPPSATRFVAALDVADLASCTYEPPRNSATGQWQVRIATADNPAPRASILDAPAANKLRVKADEISDLLVLCSYEIG